MAQVLIRGGETFETSSPGEVREIIREAQISEAAALREELRGVKLLRRDSSLTTPATSRLTTIDSITPEAGYIWCILMISAQLASSGSLQAFITSDTSATFATTAVSRRLVASTSTNNQYPALPIPKNACVLLEGEGLLLNASVNIQSYFMSGWMLPAEMQGKLL